MCVLTCVVSLDLDNNHVDRIVFDLVLPGLACGSPAFQERNLPPWGWYDKISQDGGLHTIEAYFSYSGG
jgi:hypothetical protein